MQWYQSQNNTDFLFYMRHALFSEYPTPVNPGHLKEKLRESGRFPDDLLTLLRTGDKSCDTA